MGEVVRFKPRKRLASAIASKRCTHSWRKEPEQVPDAPDGHRVEFYRCVHCGTLKSITRRE